MGAIPLLVVQIACKATLILGLLATLFVIAGRRRPRFCTIFKRVGIVALLMLPITAATVPSIRVPLLPAPERAIHERITARSADSTKLGRLKINVDPGMFESSAPKEFFRTPADIDWESTETSAADSFPVAQSNPTTIKSTNNSISIGRMVVMGFFAVYLLISVAMLVRLIGAWRGLARMKQSSVPITDFEWLTSLQRWRSTFNIQRTVALRVSDVSCVPMTFGWRSPVILIPNDCLLHCDSIQREAILVHELTHISRSDFAWQFLAHLAVAIYWVNPLVWFIKRESEALLERMSDQICSQYLGRHPYSLALVQIAARAISAPKGGIAIAMTQPSSLHRRLSDLSNSSADAPQRSGRAQHRLVIFMATIVLGLIVVGMLTAQNPASLEQSSITLVADAAVAPPNSGDGTKENPCSLPLAPQTTAVIKEESLFHPNSFNRRSGARYYYMRKPFDQTYSGWFGVPLAAASIDVDSHDHLTVKPSPDNLDYDRRSIETVESRLHNVETASAQSIVNEQSEDPKIEWDDDTEEFNAQVAATVNGQPIFNGTILDIYSKYLSSVREELLSYANNPKRRPPGRPEPTIETYQRLRSQLIKKDLAAHIHKLMLVQYLMVDTTPEQLAETYQRIDEQFEREIERLQRELKVSTREECVAELKRLGTNLKRVKENFALDRLSSESFALKSDPVVPISDSEILEYYNSHLDKYDEVTKGNWQTVSVPNSNDFREKLKTIVDKLNEGEFFESDEFAQLIKADPKVTRGTYKEMADVGLTDREFKKNLLDSKLGSWSELIERADSLFVFRVTEPRDARRKPVSEVQDEIRADLTNDQNRKRVRDYLKKVYASTKIEAEKYPEVLESLRID